MKKLPLLFMTLTSLAVSQLHAADTDAATGAINALGIDLLAKTGNADENALLSPYSIQTALAMAYVGAAGETRDEMAKALHFPKDDAELNRSFAALKTELAGIEKSTAETTAHSQGGGPTQPITLSVANRLYGQSGYDFRSTYLAVLKESYGAPLEQVNFKKAPGSATNLINAWVENRTHNRIRDLIPAGALGKETRLVLVNAIYIKAAWEDEFDKTSTQPGPFHGNRGATYSVPLMNNVAQYGYAKRRGYTVVSLPYVGENLQFLILLPDRADDLPALESRLTSALLAGCAKLKPAEVNLWLPSFKLELPPLQLSGELEDLGMKTAFDDPQGSANFDRMAPRSPHDYLFVSKVFHKTFFALDEHGTEAAAATAVTGKETVGVAMEPPRIYKVRVDHPFLFAIQDCKSGACLFIGRVTDPR